MMLTKARAVRASSTLGGEPVKTEPVFNPRYVEMCSLVSVGKYKRNAIFCYEWI